MANNKKIRGLTVEIGGDTKKLGEALDDSKKKSQKLQTELNQVQKLLKMDPKNVELVAQKHQVLTERVEESKKRLDALKQAQERVTQLYDKGEIDEGHYRDFQRQVEFAKQDLEKLEKQLKTTGDEFAEVQRKSGAMNFSNAESKVDYLKGKFHDFKESALKDMQEVSDGFNKAGESLEKVGSFLNKGSAVAGAALVGGTKFAMDFEDAMAKVSTIADENEVPMDKLRQQILELSNETGVAATDVAENVYNAISAGQDTADAVNFVSRSLALSKSGFTDAASGLDILTTIMNAYGLEAEEVNNVSDMLIQTQNLGKVTVAQLAQNMGQVIPTANAYGVKPDQLAAAYSITTANGINAANSTTYINKMLDELGKSGTKASDILKDKTGKSFSELMDEGYSLSDVLAIIKESADEQGKSLNDMFGSANAAKAANTLLGDSAKEFNDRLQEMNASTGATDTALGKLKTTSSDTKKIVNELKNAGVDLGDEVLKQAAPILKDVMGGVKDVTKWLKSLSDAEKKQLTKMLEIIAVAGPVVTLVGKGYKGIGSLIGIIPKMTAAQKGLNAALSANPVGAVTLAITAFVAVLGGAITAINALNDAKLADLGFTEQLSVVNDAAEKIKETKDSIKEMHDTINNSLKDGATEIGVIDDYKSRLDELLKKSDWSSSEVQELKTIGQYFSEKSPEFQKAWDEYTLIDDKGQFHLKENAEKVTKNLDGIIEKYKQVAATEALTDISRQNREGASKSREKVDEAIQEQILAQEKLEDFLKEWGLNDAAKREEVWGLMNHVSVSNVAGTESVSAENLRNQYKSLIEAVGESAADLDEIITDTAQFDVNAKDINRMLSVVGGDLDDAAAVYMTFLKGYIDESTIRKSQYETIDQLRREAEEQSKADNENMLYGGKKGIENYKPSITKSSLEQAKLYLKEYEKVAENEVKNYVATPDGIITKLTESDYKVAKKRFEENAANYHSLLAQLNLGVGGVTQEMVDNAERAMISSQNDYAAAATIAEVSSDEIKQTISNLNRDSAYIAANDTAFQDAYAQKMAQTTQTIEDETPNAKRKSQNYGNVVREEFDLQLGELPSKTKESVEGSTEAIKNETPNAQKAGKELGDRAVEGAESADTKSSGQNFVSGFINGLKDGSLLNNLWNAAKNMASTALDAVKSFLGIASPSKEAYKVGDFFNQGFVNALRDGNPEAQKEVERLAQIVRDTLGDKMYILDEMPPYSLPDSRFLTDYNVTHTHDFQQSAELRAMRSDIQTLNAKIDALANRPQRLYLDGRTLVGGTIGEIDRQMAGLAFEKERGG